jgi:SHS2 domain-containing protein
MYRFINHTADIAFEISAKSLKELLENSTTAFYDAFVFLDRLENGREKELEVQADGADYLLFKWLNELLYLLNTEFFAAKKFKIEVDENNFYASGILKGGMLNPGLIKVEPKAITLHEFKVEKRDGWYAFVVVDI